MEITMNFDLTGKKALVTGGSRGIGRAIAVKLAEAGADVAINYLRKVTSADKTADMIHAAGKEAMVVKANVANEEHLQNMFNKIQKKFEIINGIKVHALGNSQDLMTTKIRKKILNFIYSLDLILLFKYFRKLNFDIYHLIMSNHQL